MLLGHWPSASLRIANRIVPAGFLPRYWGASVYAALWLVAFQCSFDAVGRWKRQIRGFPSSVGECWIFFLYITPPIVGAVHWVIWIDCESVRFQARWWTGLFAAGVGFYAFGLFAGASPGPLCERTVLERNRDRDWRRDTGSCRDLCPGPVFRKSRHRLLHLTTGNKLRGERTRSRRFPRALV